MSRKPGTILKIVAIAAAAAVALLLFAAIVVPLLIPSDKIKDFATRKASETLKRKVSLSKVSISLFKGVVLQELSVGERAGFGEGPFVTASEIRVRYSLFSLLARKPVIGSVRLVRPRIVVTRNAKGELSVADLAGGGAAVAVGTPAPTASAPEFLIATIEVKDGELLFRDQAVTPGRLVETKVSNLQVALGNVSLAGTVTYRISADLQGAALSLDGAVELPALGIRAKTVISNLRPAAFAPYLAASGYSVPDGTIGIETDATIDGLEHVKQTTKLRLSGVTVRAAAGGAPLFESLTLPIDLSLDGRLEKLGEALTIQKLTLSVPGAVVEARGRIAGLKTRQTLDLAWTVSLDLKLLGAAAKLLVPSEVRLSGSARLDGTAKGPAETLTVAGTFTGEKAGFAYGTAASKVEGSAMSASFHATLGKVLVAVLDDFRLAELAGPKGALVKGLSMSASVDGPKARFQVAAEKLDGSVALAAAAAAGGVTPAAKGASPAAAAPTSKPGETEKAVRAAAAQIPVEQTVEGVVRVKEFTYVDYRATDFSATVKLARRVLSIDPVAMKAYGGTVRAGTAFDLSKDPLAGRATFDVRNVEANGFLKATNRKAERMHGTLAMTGDLAWRGVETPNVKKTLNGQGTFRVSDGRYVSPPVLLALSSAIGKSLADEVRIRTLTATWKVKDGVVETSDLKLDGDDVKASGRATCTLEGAVNGRLNTKLSPSIADKAGLKYGRDAQGWVPVAFDVTGPLDDPKVGVDLSQLMKQAGQQLLEEKGKDALQKGLEKLLKR